MKVDHDMSSTKKEKKGKVSRMTVHVYGPDGAEEESIRIIEPAPGPRYWDEVRENIADQIEVPFKMNSYIDSFGRYRASIHLSEEE